MKGTVRIIGEVEGMSRAQVSAIIDACLAQDSPPPDGYSYRRTIWRDDTGAWRGRITMADKGDDGE